MERRRLCEWRLLKALTVKGKDVTQMGYLGTYRHNQYYGVSSEHSRKQIP
jgi:hypothetical protein